MKYFYARVSTKGQNLARQIDASDALTGIAERFCDKQSGKSFDRPEYQRMKSILAAGDEVIVKSLDRLGRNKEETKSELAWFRKHGVIVRVMDLPTTMIEFPVGQEWVLEMVNNILFEVLSAIAEQERNTIRKRQAEGIASMPIVDGRRVSSKTGRGFGRPKCGINVALIEHYAEQQKSGLLTVDRICLELGISRSTWYALAKERAAAPPTTEYDSSGAPKSERIGA